MLNKTSSRVPTRISEDVWIVSVSVILARDNLSFPALISCAIKRDPHTASKVIILLSRPLLSPNREACGADLGAFRWEGRNTGGRSTVLCVDK